MRNSDRYFIISLNIIKALVNAMQMISMEEWSVVVARVAVSNSREKERGCLARGMGNPPGYAPMHSRRAPRPEELLSGYDPFW